MGCFGSEPSVSVEDQVVQNELAALRREQFSDYVTRYQPLFDELAAESADPTLIREAGQRAAGQVDTAYDVSQGVTNRTLSRYNRQLNPAQRATHARVLAHSQGKARAHAANTATLTAADRQDALRSDVIGIGQGVRSEALGNLSSAAGMENQRAMNNVNRQGQDRANTWSMVGGLAGMGLSALMLSTEKSKKQIKPADTKTHLGTVRGLSLKNYKYREGWGQPGGTRTGVIAEDAPDEITTPGKDMVHLGDTVFTLAGAIQELDKKVLSLTRRAA